MIWIKVSRRCFVSPLVRFASFMARPLRSKTTNWQKVAYVDFEEVGPR